MAFKTLLKNDFHWVGRIKPIINPLKFPHLLIIYFQPKPLNCSALILIYTWENWGWRSEWFIRGWWGSPEGVGDWTWKCPKWMTPQLKIRYQKVQMKTLKDEVTQKKQHHNILVVKWGKRREFRKSSGWSCYKDIWVLLHFPSPWPLGTFTVVFCWTLQNAPRKSLIFF